MRSSKYIQLTLDQARKPIPGVHGGWRPNAGRPRGRTTVPHDARPAHIARYPLHVTLRLRDGAPNIASDWLMRVVRSAIAAAQRTELRVVEFNVLANHIHLVVEANDSHALSRGIQGLSVRIVRHVNRRARRRGKLFATRFHCRALMSPRDVRNVLRYVLLNRRHHDKTTRFDREWIDPCSSAAWFDGWCAPIRGRGELLAMPPPTVRARTWLLAIGWRRRGLLRFDEAPT